MTKLWIRFLVFSVFLVLFPVALVQAQEAGSPEEVTCSATSNKIFRWCGEIVVGEGKYYHVIQFLSCDEFLSCKDDVGKETSCEPDRSYSMIAYPDGRGRYRIPWKYTIDSQQRVDVYFILNDKGPPHLFIEGYRAVGYYKYTWQLFPVRRASLRQTDVEKAIKDQLTASDVASDRKALDEVLTQKRKTLSYIQTLTQQLQRRQLPQKMEKELKSAIESLKFENHQISLLEQRIKEYEQTTADIRHQGWVPRKQGANVGEGAVWSFYEPISQILVPEQRSALAADCAYASMLENYRARHESKARR